MRALNGIGPGLVAAIAATCAVTGLAMDLTGCGWASSPHTESDVTITQPVHALHIDSRAGAVTVHKGDASGGIVVRRDITYNSDQAPTPGQQVTDGTLYLTSNCTDCGIAYDVTVPESTAVTVIDHAGHVTLAGIAGPIEVTASAGRVEGTGLRAATVTVDASAGAVDLSFATPPTEVTAHSHAGEVTVAVPNGPYAVTATAKAGRRSVWVTENPTSPHHLTAWSDAGAVTVQPA